MCGQVDHQVCDLPLPPLVSTTASVGSISGAISSQRVAYSPFENVCFRRMSRFGIGEQRGKYPLFECDYSGAGDVPDPVDESQTYVMVTDADDHHVGVDVTQTRDGAIERVPHLDRETTGVQMPGQQCGVDASRFHHQHADTTGSRRRWRGPTPSVVWLDSRVGLLTCAGVGARNQAPQGPSVTVPAIYVVTT